MPTEMPPEDAPEHVLCKWWRAELMEWTREQLSGLTGYSVSSIRDFEKDGKDIDAAVRKRYRLACIAAALGIQFDWVDLTMNIDMPITLSIRPEDKRR
jgi:hypothetical protein